MNNALQQAINQAVRKQLYKETKLHRLLYVHNPEKNGNKYHVSEKAERTDHTGTLFASKKEMERWHELKLLEQAGEITDLQRQVPFILQDEFISKQPEWGEVKHIAYVADFVYINITYRKGYEGRTVVEDSKTGISTPEYRVKRKLFLFKYASYLFYEV